MNTSEDIRLSEYRRTIDSIDSEIWQLILQRQQVSKQIGEYKHSHDMNVLQPERLEQIIRDRLAWARQHGISEDTVRAVTEALHSESVRVQIEG